MVLFNIHANLRETRPGIGLNTFDPGGVEWFNDGLFYKYAVPPDSGYWFGLRIYDPSGVECLWRIISDGFVIP